MSIIGKPAPAFTGEAAHNGDTVNLSLDDYQGKWLVLFFYPLDFTFVCPTEIVAFDQAYEEFQAAGAEVLGCSVDSVHTHLAYMRTPRDQAGIGSIRYPLLSDLYKSIASAYDVLDGDRALRGVFLIDPDGVVQSATINNLSVGRNVNEVLRTLKAFQHAREHGETCPAN
ncbi:MAG: peroxiredoxin, partial [Deltaproteobacteria bacterium]|nr:peroxiredoxin [Deltaproteobacteria bacterium]